jgi:hypothetical protein
MLKTECHGKAPEVEKYMHYCCNVYVAYASSSV